MIEGGNFQNDFSIIGGSFKHSLFIFDGNFQGTFSIYDGDFQNALRISGGNFQSTFSIYGGNFQGAFLIEDGNFIGAFTIYGGNFENVLIDNLSGYINHAKILTQSGKKISINSARIHNLEFNGVIKPGSSVHLENTKLMQLEFSNNFKNNGELYISGVSALTSAYQSNTEDDDPSEPLKSEIYQSKISFSKCDLGNARFLNTDFDSFDKIIIHRSKLNNISTSHGHIPLKTKGPDSIYTQEIREENKPIQYKEVFSELAETYIHLELAMQKDGNRTWAMKYYAEYMEWHRQALLEQKDYANATVLFFNRWSTYYGTNWFMGIGWVFAIALVFYVLYCTAHESIQFGFQYFTKDNIQFHLGKFFQFIYPVHKFDFLSGSMANGYAIIVDFVSRLFIGYFIYQTVAAFRRFGKR